MTVTGERADMRGKKPLRVRVKDLELVQDFWLADIQDQCIIGLDLLTCWGACVDTAKRAITLGTETLALQCGQKQGAEGARARRDRRRVAAAQQISGPGGSGSSLLTSAPASQPNKSPSTETTEAVGDLWQRSSVGLNIDQRQRLRCLLDENVDIFAASDKDSRQTGLVQHTIDTGSAQPIRLRPHRLPLSKRQVAEEKIREMAAAGVIEPSNSPWAAPVVLVGKKNGSPRFCVDFRRLNAVTKKDSFPLPRIDEALDYVTGSNWFSSLDWGDACAAAFAQLKEDLTRAPVLAYPDARQPFIVDTDASNVGVRAVLSQQGEAGERVVAYFSRALGRAERNYCVTRRELLAVVLAVRHFRPYLHGCRFLLRTDHASLTWLLNFKHPEGQVARWLEVLQGYDFEIQHRAGRQHGNADALSRRPCMAVECRYCLRQEERAQEALWVATAQATASGGGWLPLTTQQLKREQEADATLGQGRDLLQLLVPRLLRSQVLELVHGSVGAGHYGNAKTLRRLRGRFYWPGCRRDVELHVHCCDTCTAQKGPTQRSTAPLQQYLVGAPMERVDVLGPFPVTESGNRYVLVVMDYFTKWPEAYAVPDQSATTTAERLVEEMFACFGVLAELHSDQGRNFESKVFGEICRQLGVEKTRTTPLHPQSDGLVERFNRTLATQLAILTSRHQRDWDRYLPLVLWSYRTAVQESSQCTPAALMFGRELRTPVDLVFGSPPPSRRLTVGQTWTTTGG
uniref:Gypsy retrotransposon integrase-like protein 1 n=1 Tax=Oreochromis aureus TaxID=47969 RepID=A0AAZ1X8S4_OREAU